MNGLFIAPYRQNDGWGHSAVDYLKAIQTQITDMSARPIYYVDNRVKNLDDTVKDCENKIFDNYDNESSRRAIGVEVVIQSNEKTLSEKEINDLSDKIIKTVEDKFNAKLR